MWYCRDCLQPYLEKRGKRHLFCHVCRRLSTASETDMAWYAAEFKRIEAGKMKPENL